MIVTGPLTAQFIDFDNSVAGRIARVLSERIVSGLLSPGERLMQDHIAKEFQASHVPVREAFRKLEAQGLVVSKARCGVRVSDLDPAMVREVASTSPRGPTTWAYRPSFICGSADGRSSGVTVR